MARAKGIEALTGLPHWPLMLNEPQAAAYVGLTLEDFRAAVKAGEVPTSRTLRGKPLWNRQQIDRRFDDPEAPAIGETDELTDVPERWSPKCR